MTSGAYEPIPVRDLMDPEVRRRHDRIEACYQRIAMENRKVLAIVLEAVPDFHFLRYQVATFWTCKDSPMGWCLFELDEFGRVGNCRYCHAPLERQ